MSKKIQIVLLAVILVLLHNCKAPNYVPTFNIDASIAPSERDDIEEAGLMGYEMYKKFCGSCHGITQKGKNAIPDFSKEEMDDYNLRFKMGEVTHTGLEDLSDNQLANIQIFLTYRKKD